MGSGPVLDPEVEQMLTKLNLMCLKAIFLKEENELGAIFTFIELESLVRMRPGVSVEK